MLIFNILDLFHNFRIQRYKISLRFPKKRKSQAVKYMLNGIYDAIKGYLTSRKTLNNEKQTHDRANKCLKKRMYMP